MAAKKRKSNKHQAEAISEALTEKQKLFCQLYITDKECFGNASKAYRTAYCLTPTQYKASAVSAHRLLRNDNILAYQKHLLEEMNNDGFVDQETTRVIAQNNDLNAKGAMIKEYNKVKQRIVEKSEVEHKFPTPILGSLTVTTAKTKATE